MRKRAYWRDAETSYERALALAPNEETYLLAAGFQSLANGDAAAAARFYTHAAEVVPNSADAYAGLAWTAAAAGDCAHAREHLAHARALYARTNATAQTTKPLDPTEIPKPARRSHAAHDEGCASPAGDRRARHAARRRHRNGRRRLRTRPRRRATRGRRRRAHAVARRNLDPWRFDRRVLWDQLLLPLAAARSGATLLHAASGTMPLIRTLPTVVTVHDLAWHRVQSHTRAYARAYFGQLQSRAYRTAAAIVCDSHFTRKNTAR